jgi:hypothetical protein
MSPYICIHVLDQTSVTRNMITACRVRWPYTISHTWHHLALHTGIYGKIRQAVLMSADSTHHINRPAANYFNRVQSQPLHMESQHLLHCGLQSNSSHCLCHDWQHYLNHIACSLCTWLLQTITCQNVQMLGYWLQASNHDYLHLAHLHSLPNTNSKHFLLSG